MGDFKKIIHHIALLTGFLLFATFVKAQEIKGKIIDAESRKPIQGANVYLNGTYKGTISNSEGDFTLSTNEINIPLIVSYVGYESQTINDYNGKMLQVLLRPKVNQ